MQQGAVYYQRDTNDNVKECEPIKKKETRFGRGRCNLVESEEEENEPKHRVDSFDGEFSCCEQEWKERYMPGDSQWSKCAKVPSILERD
jgi:hypothetical protein